MKKIFVLALVALPAFAAVEIVQPLMTLTDDKGNAVGTKSSSAVKAMEKASGMPNGTYYLVRPNATITVTGGDPVEPPVEPPIDPPAEPPIDPVDPPVDPVEPPVEPPISIGAITCPDEPTEKFSKTSWFVCSVNSAGDVTLSPNGIDYPMSYMIPNWGFTDKPLRVFMHPYTSSTHYVTGASSFRFSLDLVEIHNQEQRIKRPDGTYTSGGWWMYSGSPKGNYSGRQIAASIDYVLAKYPDQINLEQGIQLTGTSLGGTGAIGQAMILPKYQDKIASVSSTIGIMILPKTNPSAVSGWSQAQYDSVDFRKQWAKVQGVHFRWTGGANDTFKTFDTEFMEICEQRKISCTVTWLQSGHGFSESGYSIPMWWDNKATLDKVLPVITNNSSNHMGAKRGYYNLGIKWDHALLLDTSTEVAIPLTYVANKGMGGDVPDQPDTVTFSITPRHVKNLDLTGTIVWTLGGQSGTVTKGADGLVTIDGLSLNTGESKVLSLKKAERVPVDPPIDPADPPTTSVGSIVYTRIPRTRGVHTVTIKGVTREIENIDIWDTLPEVSRRSAGFNAPGQLIIREADGNETIIFDCFKTVRPCVPLDPSVSLDGKKIAFTVHSADKLSSVVKSWVTLPNQYLSGAGAQAQIHIYDIDSGTTTKWPHVKGSFDTAPVWLPDGKMMFSSRRNGHYRPWIKGLTPGIGGKEYRLYIANQDGSNPVDVSPHEVSAASHPYLKADGRIAYSSLWLSHNLAFNSTNGGVNWFGTTENFWVLLDTDRAGGDMTALLGAHKAGFRAANGRTKTIKALHFIGQRKNSDVCVANYYRANNLGLGDVWCFTPEAKGVEGKLGNFNPRNLYSAALWSKSNDEGPFTESSLGLGEKGSKLLGKVGWPEGAQDGQLILTKGTGWCTRVASAIPSTPDSLKNSGRIGCDLGLYKTTIIPSLHPDDLELIVDDPAWHEYGARVITARVIAKPPLMLTGDDTCVLASSDAGTAETKSRYGYKFNSNYKTAGESGQEIDGIDHNEMTAIRFWAIEPNKTKTYPTGWKNSIGHDLKLLGDAPLLADKSFAAELPCETPYIMAGIDSKGRVIKRDQIPQSLRKGEKRVCMGCHRHSSEGRPYEQSDAFTAIPTKVDLFKAVPTYNKDIKPILDARCASCHAAGDVVLDDYNKLVWDYTQKYVQADRKLKVREHSDPWRAYGLQRPYTSKYVNTMFARESLLYWKAANKRTDGRTDDTYSDDIDFGVDHPTTMTAVELALLAGWLDSGAGQ